MTPELRLDRAERVLMLIIKAGYRARKESRAQDEKLKILIDAQLKTDEQLKSLREGQAALQESQVALQESLKGSHASFRASLRESDASFRALLRENEASFRASLQENETTFRAALQESHGSLQEGQSKLEKVMAELAEEHKATERSLKAFLDGLKGRNGGSST